MTQREAPRLLDPLFTADAMRAVFDDRARLQGMLDFEAALARAEARTGVIPAAAASHIESACRAEGYDVAALAAATAHAGNPAIPLVDALTTKVTAMDPNAGRYVHWGATSQDAVDTGLVLQMRAAFGLLESQVARLVDVLSRLATTHRHTLMAGRTWLQQAVPLTLGLKAAGWLSALVRDRERLRALQPRVLVLQFGGAAGSLAALGDRGLAVATALAEDLQLALPDVPWHAQRDRIAETGATLALLTGSLGKIGRDVSLLMQTEVAEASEPVASGRAGSSTMPQKRNPVGCVVALAASIRAPALASTLLAAMVQEHERGLGGWHAEWETLPELFRLATGAAESMAGVLGGLEVDRARMRSNLDVTGGLIFAEQVAMALAKHVGKEAAYRLVAQACGQVAWQRRRLREVLHDVREVREHLGEAEIDALFAPEMGLGVVDQLIDRALQGARGT